MISRAFLAAVLVVALAAPAAAAGAERTDVDLATPPLARLAVPGASSISAAPAGDVNGDRIADLAYANDTTSSAGREQNG